MNPLITFLPENRDKNSVDVMLVTGDVYIDHPSFGIAIIARVLEAEGLSVAIVSQPHYFDFNYLNNLPDVKYFIGITSGNMDSIVSNYTSNRNYRNKDVYSIDGNPYFDNKKRKRPDRALITYTAFIKKRYKNIPVVIGGIEASLRRFAHYDYIQNKIRRSVLIDSKADILVYSMGEKAVVEIYKRILNNETLKNINGTAVKYTKKDFENIDDDYVLIPSYDEINIDKKFLIDATIIIEKNMVYNKSSILAQNQGNDYVICNPPQPPLTQIELDKIYSLPFKKDYPDYCKKVPAWQMINTSITSHRGCFGRCSFCAIASHQGPVIRSRSEKSVIDEIEALTKLSFFKNTISDVGGPTANMYGIDCKIGWCKNPKCLYPKLCENLILNPAVYKDLLVKVKQTADVKNIYISSGIRYDLALHKLDETEWIIANATPGHLKIAPEHVDNNVLKLMNKPDIKIFDEFINFFNKIKTKYNLNIYLLPYIILSHPGSTLKSVNKIKQYLKKNNIKTYQIQDFTPTPQTLSTAFFVSKLDMEYNSLSVPIFSSLNNPQRQLFFKK